MSEGIIELQVLGDNEPETDEVLLVNLTYVQPPSSQRINPARRVVNVVIRENDQPGGIFQFGPAMKNFYTLRVSFKVISYQQFPYITYSLVYS